MFLKILPNFKGKYLCWSLFLIKLQAYACNFIKKRLQHRPMPATLLKRDSNTGLLKNTSERLLLNNAILSTKVPRQSCRIFICCIFMIHCSCSAEKSNKGVFLWNLGNFWEHLFWRTFVKTCFCLLNSFIFWLFHISGSMFFT